MFNNKSILVTGGTGSFGKSFVEYILNNFKPKKLIIFSRDELKQYDMLNSFIKHKNFNKLRFLLGDVRDRERLNLAFKNVDFVIHAAALKQIPAAEYNPQEVIKTNIGGAENIVFAAIEQKVKKVIALSTDKAANPVNLYGATKLVSDKLFIAGNRIISSQENTQFSVVRYGNVINSRGSVIPFFLNCFKDNKMIPITHKDMTRFFISLDGGIKFVVDSFKRMKGGEIFIPKLPSIKIIDIAKAINKNAKIKIIGLRPGEKIHEILCPKDESHMTIEFKDHYIICPSITESKSIKFYLSNARKEKGKKVKEGYEYNSYNNPVKWNVSKIKKELKF